MSKIIVTDVQLRKLSPSLSATNAVALATATNATMDRYSLNTDLRVARYFVAQCAAETKWFTSWTEELNYPHADRLPVVWPTRFYLRGPDRSGKVVNIGRGPRNAVDYAGKPEKLANAVYGDRFGNRGEASGDGWRFIGRGATHLTFRDNYRSASLGIYGNDCLVENPERVAGYDDGMLTAGWYWSTRNLATLAAADEWTKVTGAINGASGADLARVVAERNPYLTKTKTILA